MRRRPSGKSGRPPPSWSARCRSRYESRSFRLSWPHLGFETLTLSQADPAGLDAVVQRGVELDVGLELGMIEQDDVGDGRGVVAVADQVLLGVLERRRHVERAAD